MTVGYGPIRKDVALTSLWQLGKAINWLWWLQRLPMFLLAVPAAWGVGAFAAEKYPPLIAIVAGAGFEAAYMGAIAFADQQLEQDTTSKVLWWALNVAAVACSALINVLFSAGGMFSAIELEDIVHGAPLAILNFLYALLLHRNATQSMQIERKTAEDNKFPCPKCGRGFSTANRLNGHKRHCK
jgi:hypothetical protein